MSEHTVHCADCNKALMHYMIISSEGQAEKIRANCPFCQGQSYVIEVQGKSLKGPIGRDENLHYKTVINNIDFVNGVWIFDLLKVANED